MKPTGATLLLFVSAAACGGTATSRVHIRDDAGSAPTDGGAPRRSCSGLAEDCGPDGDESCCASPLVPGGSFYRSYDGVSTRPNDYTIKAYPATVSDFRLDKYEVTVGRFRRFVATYAQDMVPAHAGKNPNDPNDSGWDAAWNESLPATASALIDSIKCFWPEPAWTWTDSPGADENKPINCASWYVAFAFCSWDDGRLPTEAEWNYAAAGGSEQRVYPWGSDAPDCSYANYRGAAGGADFCVLPGTGAPNDVGSESPKDNGRWGHAGLAGNLTEWNLDWYAPTYPQVPCLNCANSIPNIGRVVRGADYVNHGDFLRSSVRNLDAPSNDEYSVGIRCGRNP